MKADRDALARLLTPSLGMSFFRTAIYFDTVPYNIGPENGFGIPRRWVFLDHPANGGMIQSFIRMPGCR